MPIIIYRQDGSGSKVTFLANDDWNLASQIDVLESWLLESGNNLPAASYVADLGFRPRPDASGGGGALSVAAMRVMADKGIELFLSEYLC